jgi:hypothetical protein
MRRLLAARDAALMGIGRGTAGGGIRPGSARAEAGNGTDLAALAPMPRSTSRAAGTMPRVALVVTAAVLVAACSRPAPARPAPAPPAPAPRACTQIGCASGLQVVIDGAPAGAFRVEARAEDGEERARECAAPEACGRIFFADFVPPAVTVRVIAGDAVSSTTVRPDVVTLQPNGPGCPPTCRVARVEVPWPAAGGAAASGGGDG